MGVTYSLQNDIIALYTRDSRVTKDDVVLTHAHLGVPVEARPTGAAVPISVVQTFGPSIIRRVALLCQNVVCLNNKQQISQQRNSGQVLLQH